MEADCGLSSSLATKVWSILILSKEEGLQIAQARITRAEIVHGHANAQFLDGVQDCDGTTKSSIQHAFGDLDLDTLWAETGFRQNGGEHPGYIMPR